MFGELHTKRYQQAVIDDAHALGLEIVSTERVAVGQMDVGERIGQFARLAIFREATAHCTEVVFHEMAQGGSRMLYVQPFQGSSGLTAFFHARLPGGFAVPVTLGRKLFGILWHAQDNPAIGELAKSGELKACAKALPWKKHNTLGQIPLEWVLQVRAFGDGSSESIFQLGSTAMDLYGTCLDRCMALRQALRPLMPDASPPKQGLYWPAPYADAYYNMLRGA